MSQPPHDPNQPAPPANQPAPPSQNPQQSPQPVEQLQEYNPSQYAQPPQPVAVNPYQTPMAKVDPHAVEGDATGGLIPYKNVPALIGYYLAVFSLIPFLGMFLGLAAVILGVVGFAKYKKTPAVRGAAHAWVAIVMGGLLMLLWGGLTLGFIILVATS